MKKKIFGTDGIRSKANGEFMNPIFFNKLAIAIDKVILSKLVKPRIIIGKDTRRSGYMIESALSSAFMALGIHVILTGPIPTAVIPFLMKEKSADLGFNISASHNPFDDNGIKIFGPNGKKLADEIELEIEKILINEDEFKYENLKYSFIDSKKIGYLSRIHNASEIYASHIEKIFSKKDFKKWKEDLSDLRIVADLANGSAYKIAPLIFKIFGLNVDKNLFFLNNKPDGFNINLECGAIHPEGLAEKVLEKKAQIGIALDGDADRIIFVDENGKIIDNDIIIAYIGKRMKEMNLLNQSKIAINITSNSGIDHYLSQFEITTKRVPVGDKYLLEIFEEEEINFGGEKSGHIIFPDFMIGGDALLSGVLILMILKKDWDSKFPDQNFELSKILNEIKLFPQVSKNFDYTSKKDFDINIIDCPDFINLVNELEQQIKENSEGSGRILVRKSGTEKKIRIIAEGKNQDIIENCTKKIISFF